MQLATELAVSELSAAELAAESTDNYVVSNKGESQETASKRLKLFRNGRLNPLNDYLFKQCFGTKECKVCLISFLNAVLADSLDEKITDVTIIDNLELPKETIDGKFSRLDVRAKLPDGPQINIEVQLLWDDMIPRSQYYNGRMYISGIDHGEHYNRLGKVISINILKFDYLEYPEYHISSHFRVDQHPEDILSDRQEIHFIQLKKFYKSEEFDRNNPLHRWLRFFDWNLKEDSLKELIQMDTAIAAASEKAKKVAASEKELHYYEALEDARRDLASSLHYSEEMGYKRGMERGLAKGEAKGEAMGEARGEARLMALMNRLLQDNRMEDMQKMIKQPELRNQFFQEYGL